MESEVKPGHNNFFRSIIGDCGGMLWIFIIAGVVIAGYYLVSKLAGKSLIDDDLFNRHLGRVPLLGDVSGWRLSHLILFFVLGVFYPKCDVPILTAGVLWEVWEEIVSHFVPKEKSTGGTNVDYKEKWWTGSLNDIWFNVIGFYLGKLTRYLYDRLRK